ncbi:GNAT family N-acetyltransferase [Clostridium tetani]|uniref:GNAT family N-acetyltransferase n=1 Tax=Clostridium tetani TaxID=1513 RepID=UPI0009B89DF5|nr:hypothetical protein [Clostridium tetani]SUY66232.1 acetyltransferase [Clostridium tetani]
MNWHVKKFKELKCEEIYKILQIRNKIFIVEQKCAYQDCDDRDKKSYHVYVEDKGEIVSYLRILPRKVSYEYLEDNIPHIDMLYKKS